MRWLRGLLFLIAAALPAQAQNTLPSANWGDMIYRGPAVWTQLAPGVTFGPYWYLRTNGPNQAPSWEQWTYPAQATNTILGNVSGVNAAPIPILPTQFLDVVAYDVLKPQADPGTILYRGIGSLGWQKLPPGTAGQVLNTGGLTTPPFWSNVAGSDLNAICTTQGAVLYRNASSWVCLTPGTNGQFLTTAGAAANPAWTTGGTVFSVGLSMPAQFSVAGSPVTGTGTFAVTLANQTANTIWAGPATGAAAAPAFRALVNADIPVPTLSALGGVQAVSPVANQWINSINTSGVPQLSQPSFADLTGTITVAQGGTAITSYAVGDLIQATGATTLSPLAAVATGNALISGGVTTASSWGKIGLTTHISGILPLANGGTGVALTDPNADRIMFWDDSAGAVEWLTVSTGLDITNTTLTAVQASTSVAGIGQWASTADYRANTASRVLTTDQVWASADYVSLTSATNITIDFSAGFNFTVSLAHNATLGAPSNTKNGQTGVIYVVQTAGSNTMAYNAVYKWAGGTACTLSTAAAAVDRLTYIVRSSTFIDISCVKDIK